MSGRVTYINDDTEEYLRIPDATSSQQIAMVGYVLFQGPLDGTSYPVNYDMESDRIQGIIGDVREQELEYEEKKFEEYLEDRPSYILNRFDREHGAFTVDSESRKKKKAEDNPEAFEEFCREQSRSTYRDDDGEWMEHRMVRVGAASYELSEWFEFLGRWAGDDVRLVFDPDPDELAGYEDIRDGIVNEMHQTLPDNFLVDGEYVLTPDMVITASDDGGGDEDEPESTDSGNDEPTLFGEH